MNIRKFTKADKQTYLDLVTAFYQDDDAVDHVIPAHHAERTFATLMEGTPYADAFLAEDSKGTPLGFVLLALTWSNEAGGLTVWIEELFTYANARGCGVGTALMDTVRSAYPNAARFRLEVTANNVHATQMYRSRGYQPLAYNQMILDFPPPEQQE